MIQVEKLSYSFPEKDLYKNVSFTLQDGAHCALIGSNGTGKSTLIQMMMEPDEWLYKGKIIRKDIGRIGYVSQFFKTSKENTMTVFEYLSQYFVELQQKNEELCAEMATSENLDEVFERYQKVMDEIDAVDGNNYESNIGKQLKLAGMKSMEGMELGKLSGGEYKLVQVIREMMQMPSLLIMDEPDVFLDFENLNGLRQLINSYKGTILVITHNRYLLNNCFNKILHLEDADIQEFDGNFVDYNFALLQRKIELQEQVAEEMEELERTRAMVDRLRAKATRFDNASFGRTVHAKQSQLDRLEARMIKAPFVEVRLPEIVLPVLEQAAAEAEETEKTEIVSGPVLNVQDYRLEFEDMILENVSFELNEGEKVAIVGPNGTGKTTLLRQIANRSSEAVSVRPDVEIGFLSQNHSETLNEDDTIYKEFEALGFETNAEIKQYLAPYFFAEDVLDNRIGILSGGEKNLLQLAKIGAGKAGLLLLDEPTSHLDIYSQAALEKALADYKGTVLMVSHDFYTIVNTMDYVLYVEDKTIRKMRVRSFRKMIYKDYFEQEYLELEQKKKELEMKIEDCLRANDFEKAKAISEELEVIVRKM
ncbi:MAG: ABC-F family ATP-binding cassette domain-containing protein [Lachnospiraceae bacterium]|nr:ABC-F family ATP-binding cassette domain-containing protein [Lachnospiraceae bacterium]MBQ2023242.1 ABC-F family ATP-binding cassette domain-containing protein [Lachnospiraceae bacterium]MBQ5660375.1 ABC-F family ATP-binding cassette domain-containing protein [Lachnospiraceae bacterium]MBQ5806415.1 ABC-F family ATP-binding cassette domain-containing protein [Lachnospiraceae bacterium]